MRERIAIGLAVLVISALVGLSGLFARSQNSGTAVAQGDWSNEVRAGAAPATPSELSAAVAPATPPVVTPAAAPAVVSPPSTRSADSIRGRVVFDSVGCARCHSAGGVGSPRYPLDGVGARRSEPELRAWILGADALADSLPPSALRTKQSYRAMKAADLDALVAFLKSLKR